MSFANQSSQFCAVKRVLPVLMLAALFEIPAFGQTVIWLGGTGDWFLPPGSPLLELPNWSCGCDPNGPGFGVNIGTGSGLGALTGVVELNMPATVAGVSLGNGAFGGLNVVSGNVLSASNAVIVGAYAAGTLNISTGGVVNDVNGSIGSLSGATGTATVSGSGSQWNNSNDLSIGLSGTGSLSIQAGGRVMDTNGFIAGNSRSSGSVSILGTGSAWINKTSLTIGTAGSLTIGSGGSSGSGLPGTVGTLTINGYGSMTVEEAGTSWNTTGAVIGGGTGGLASLMVERNATFTDSGTMTVGSSSDGALTIESAGRLADTNAILAASGSAFPAGGRVIVEGGGSQWNNLGTVTVGQVGQGTLTVQQGGSGNSTSLTIGDEENGSSVTLTDQGSTWNATSVLVGGGPGTTSLTVTNSGHLTDAGNLQVGGNSSNATLTISAGGQVTDAIGVAAGNTSRSNGSVMVEGRGSQWMNSGMLTIGGNGAGSLTIGSGGTVRSGQSFIDGNGSVTVSDQGSQWTMTSLVVGNGGTGSLAVQNQAIVNSTGGASIGVSGGNGSVSVVNSAPQLNTSSLCVGCSGSGTLMLVGGTGSASGQLDIGQQPGSSGSMSIRSGGGVGSWSNSGPVIVGDGGTGNLSLTDNATFTASQSMTIGMSGHGTLSLESDLFSGLSTGAAYIGYNSGSIGEASLSGPGTLWNSAAMTVGVAGNGTLDISAGGIVKSSQGDIALSAGSVGTVAVGGAGPGVGPAVWNVAGPLSVGDGGAGTLEVNFGGLINDTDGTIGKSAGSTGTAVMDGTASSTPAIWTNTGTLFVGFSGKGSLTISNDAIGSGASVSDNAAYVGYQPGSVGTVLVTGPRSVWSNATTLDIGFNGTGTLTVSNGGLVAAGTLQNPGTITIGTNGTVNADGGTLQGAVINHGVLDPVGPITINGDYTQGVDGTLILDVAGTGAGEYGQLDVSGNATFDGTIDLDFINDFVPSQGDSFDFINVGGSADLSGVTIDIGGLPPGFNYTNSFQNGQFILTALNSGTNASQTPEPATLLMFGTALLGLAAYWRARRKEAVSLRM